jgi:hypothetical protein
MRRLDKEEIEWIKELLNAHINWIGNENNPDVKMCDRILNKLYAKSERGEKK